MSFTYRAAARAAFHPMTRFRSIEERIGVFGLSVALLIVMTHSLWAHEYKFADIEILHPWSRATPEGARVAAGYVTLKNTGAEADRLLSATSEISGRAEIHEMAVDDKGVMTMRPTGGLELPAGQDVELQPGGYHIMFLDLLQAPREGMSFAGSLTFEKAGTVEVEFAVEAMGGGSGHGGHSGHGE